MRRETDVVADIVIAAQRIAEFLEGIDREAFEDDRLRQDAVLRRLTVIGEATKLLSAEFRAAHPQIPWREIAGMRDVLSHAYFRIDLEEVWRAAIEDCPALVRELQPLLPPPPE